MIYAFGVSIKNTPNEKSEIGALEMMEKQPKGFEIGLLCKSDNKSLPESRSTGFRRLLFVERQIHKDEEFRKKYCDCEGSRPWGP